MTKERPPTAREAFQSGEDSAGCFWVVVGIIVVLVVIGAIVDFVRAHTLIVAIIGVAVLGIPVAVFVGLRINRLVVSRRDRIAREREAKLRMVARQQAAEAAQQRAREERDALAAWEREAGAAPVSSITESDGICRVIPHPYFEVPWVEVRIVHHHRGAIAYFQSPATEDQMTRLLEPMRMYFDVESSLDSSRTVWVECVGAVETGEPQRYCIRYVGAQLDWLRSWREHSYTWEQFAEVVAPLNVPTVEHALKELDGMVGLQGVKAQVRQLLAKVEISQRRVDKGLPALSMSHHLIFAGAPGTGKTSVARVYGQLLAAAGVLRHGQFVEASRGDLVGQHQGETSLKVINEFDKAAGGLLFIDEVYSLVHGDGDDFGREAVDELVKLMEDRRDDVVVVVAGYGSRIGRFLESNPGLRSRFSEQINFPNYTNSELLTIFANMCREQGYVLAEGASEAALDAIRHFPKGPDFGNAREVRRLFEAILGRQVQRLTRDPFANNLNEVTPDDVRVATRLRSPDQQQVDTLLRRLDDMIGLAGVKRQIRDVLAEVEFNRRRRDDGLPVNQVSQNLAFVGNPGTGKTTVARLYGELLAASGVLAEGQFIETDRAKLVAGYQGQTAPLVARQFEEASGGVLFIDEVYALVHDDGDTFGKEAVGELVKLMEDKRDQVVVIVAGYTDRMQRFLASNPGLKSRLPLTIEFEDYSSTDLADIFATIARENGFALGDGVREALIQRFSRIPRGDDFGNAREARNLFAQARTNMARRLKQHPDASLEVMSVADIQSMVAGELTKRSVRA